MARPLLFCECSEYALDNAEPIAPRTDPDDEESPYCDLIRIEFNQLIRRLPPRQGAAFRWRVRYQMTYDGIAELMSITPQAAHKLVSKAITFADSQRDLGILTVCQQALGWDGLAELLAQPGRRRG